MDENMSINAPLRTLYNVRQNVRMAQRSVPTLRASIEGHFWPCPPPESVRDALDLVDLYLESIDEMCTRYEPFRVEPKETTHIDEAFASRHSLASRTFTKREANLLVSAVRLAQMRTSSDVTTCGELSALFGGWVVDGGPL